MKTFKNNAYHHNNSDDFSNMNVNVKLTGILDEIMEDAIKKGLAKTKVEVLRLGLIELKYKYKLADKEEEADRMFPFLASHKALAKDWLSKDEMERWKDL